MHLHLHGSRLASLPGSVQIQQAQRQQSGEESGAAAGSGIGDTRERTSKRGEVVPQVEVGD